jgi:HlyD family secretion protein
VESDAQNDAELEEMAEDVLEHVKKPGGRKWMKRAAIAVVVVGALVGFFVWRSAQKSKPTFEFMTSQVDRGDVVTSATATGNLEPERTVTIGAEISGLIESVEVDDNDIVKKGDVLARFDTESLRTTLKQSQAGVRSARANVRRAESVLADAKRELARIEPLVAKRIVATGQLDAARSQVESAQASVDTARAELERTQRAVDLTRVNLDKGEIVSPIDGVVLKRSVEPGNAVAASLQAPELFVIAQDLTKMELHVAVDEADIGRIEAGQPATFTVDAWPDRVFDAKVTKVSLHPTTTGNVITYDTVLSVANDDGALRPGMTATATIITGKATDVLRVPNAALRWTPPDPDAGGGLFSGPPGRRQQGSSTHKTNTVWVLEDGEPVEIEFETGRTDGRLTEVKSGELDEGTPVITGTRPLGKGKK